MTVFEFILIGHLVGDYLLQNKWMAMNKTATHFKCFVHCFIYTAALCFVTLPVIQDWRWLFIVFLSHFPIDRWSLADKWLKFINGRSLGDFYERGHENIPAASVFDQFIQCQDPKTENYRVLRGGFTALTYTVVDNTMHLILMLLGWALIK